jgi:pyruvate-ferredoxin/flavodoxin oxidoreductase
LPYDKDYEVEPDSVTRAMFYGLGSDGTVGANKNSIKIIGEKTDNCAQGYFVYDSKKAGTVTVSHLRFGPEQIRSSYLITSANFIACHQSSFIEKYDMLRNAAKGATFLLNSIYSKDEVWATLPKTVQQDIIDKELKFYVIDAYKVADATGMGVMINTIMQTCFFAISSVLDKDTAIGYIKEAIKKTYGKKGDEVVNKNNAAVDQALAGLSAVGVPAEATSSIDKPQVVSDDAPEYVKAFTAKLLAGDGASVPVSQMPEDGTFPTATSQWEKRNIALQVPAWDEDICIQCGKCSLVCPHGCLRMKIYDADKASGAPSTFKSVEAKGKGLDGKNFTLQTAVEDCTGCGSCVFTCPVKNKEVEGKKAINMVDQPTVREEEVKNYDFFLNLPEFDFTSNEAKLTPVKESQLRKPLFEYSGACAGCGETPYVKLISQLFGDRMLVANATGCSSIYGGNMPTTPYCVDDKGCGPTWSNSLFEDNAEFGFGFRLTIDKFNEYALELLDRCDCLKSEGELVSAIKGADMSDDAGLDAQRARVATLKEKLTGCDQEECKELLSVADYLVKKSVWIFGGDGWAYDIGYGGLDHVLASGKNVNVLVMDTEVYSNTGGQMSKATPRGAVAKFAAGGKPMPKKDLGLISMTYGNIYVAKVAMGANDAQTIKAIKEAESYDGPSLIMAYSHCVAHGIDMSKGMDEHKKAVNCCHWPLYRFDPRLADEGKNPMQLDSKDATTTYEDFTSGENRFRMLQKIDPAAAKELIAEGQKDVDKNWAMHKRLAE